MNARIILVIHVHVFKLDKGRLNEVNLNVSSLGATFSKVGKSLLYGLMLSFFLS